MATAINTAANIQSDPIKLMARKFLVQPATVCAWCGKVRTAARVWQKIPCRLECCSHTACPDCYESAIIAMREELCNFDF